MSQNTDRQYQRWSRIQEKVWEECDNPSHVHIILDMIKGLSPRRIRLAAVGAVRASRRLTAAQRAVLDAAEAFADGQISTTQLKVVPVPDGTSNLAHAVRNLTHRTAIFSFGGATCLYAVDSDGGLHKYKDPRSTEKSRPMMEVVRDVFGNPFRPVKFPREWRTTTVIGLAREIYEQRAFDRMPILADALEEAGCDNVGILAHCRGSGPHVRGCWVLDLALGKK